MASTVWKGHLTFGLLSLPVKLYSAARSESVGFNQLHKHDNSRVKKVLYCQAEDKPISADVKSSRAMNTRKTNTSSLTMKI